MLKENQVNQCAQDVNFENISPTELFTLFYYIYYMQDQIFHENLANTPVVLFLNISTSTAMGLSFNYIDLYIYIYILYIYN